MGKRRREPYPDTPDLARADIIALALDRCPTGIRNPLRDKAAAMIRAHAKEVVRLNAELDAAYEFEKDDLKAAMDKISRRCA